MFVFRTFELICICLASLSSLCMSLSLSYATNKNTASMPYKISSPQLPKFSYYYFSELSLIPPPVRPFHRHQLIFFFVICDFSGEFEL